MLYLLAKNPRTDLHLYWLSDLTYKPISKEIWVWAANIIRFSAGTSCAITRVIPDLYMPSST